MQEVEVLVTAVVLVAVIGVREGVVVSSAAHCGCWRRSCRCIRYCGWRRSRSCISYCSWRRSRGCISYCGWRRSRCCVSYCGWRRSAVCYLIRCRRTCRRTPSCAAAAAASRLTGLINRVVVHVRWTGYS
jgi:hypothetical protein